MIGTKTLIVSTDTAGVAAKALPAEFGLRPCNSGDIEALGVLYIAAYPPGVACTTLEVAVADIRATFSGEYGELLPRSSRNWDSGSGAGHASSTADAVIAIV